MKPALLLMVFVTLGCNRCSERVAPSPASLRFQPRAVTLGPTWVGAPVEQTVEVKNESRQRVRVELSVEGPFSASASAVELAAGAAADLVVRFEARESGTFWGRLVAADVAAELELVGIAEEPPTCLALGPCRRATFDRVTGACVESPLPEGTSCSVSDACSVSGACRAGGCVAMPRSCPAPADPCLEPHCDAEAGCGSRRRADGERCGPVDCSGARLCRSGTCTLDASLKPASCVTPPQSLWVKVPLTGSPFGLATDSSDTAYVGRASADLVARIDTSLGAHTGDVAVGGVPTGLAADATRVWVTNQSSGSLSVIDRASFSVVGAPTVLGITPYLPALSGGSLYVTGASTRVLKLDPLTHAVVSTVTGTWSHANGIAFHPSLPLMYVSARDTGEVTEVNLSPFSVGRRFTPGLSPQALTVSPDGSELYVAREAGPLAVLSTSTGLVIDQVMGTSGGFALALTPDGTQLYLTRPGSGSVARIDRVTRTVVGALNTQGAPRRVGFSSNGAVAVITNEQGWVDLAR